MPPLRAASRQVRARPSAPLQSWGSHQRSASCTGSPDSGQRRAHIESFLSHARCRRALWRCPMRGLGLHRARHRDTQPFPQEYAVVEPRRTPWSWFWQCSWLRTSALLFTPGNSRPTEWPVQCPSTRGGLGLFNPHIANVAHAQHVSSELRASLDGGEAPWKGLSRPASRAVRSSGYVSIRLLAAGHAQRRATRDAQLACHCRTAATSRAIAKPPAQPATPSHAPRSRRRAPSIPVHAAPRCASPRAADA